MIDIIEENALRNNLHLEVAVLLESEQGFLVVGVVLPDGAWDASTVSEEDFKKSFTLITKKAFEIALSCGWRLRQIQQANHTVTVKSKTGPFPVCPSAYIFAPQ